VQTRIRDLAFQCSRSAHCTVDACPAGVGVPREFRLTFEFLTRAVITQTLPTVNSLQYIHYQSVYYLIVVIQVSKRVRRTTGVVKEKKKGAPIFHMVLK